MAVVLPARMVAARTVSIVSAVLVPIGTARRVQLADHLRQAPVEVAGVEVIVVAHVARLLGPFAFVVVGFEHGALDDLPAGGVDRMRDVGMKLGASIGVTSGPILIELGAALVAKAGTQMVFAAALHAPVGQLAAGHGHERALGAIDDLQVADDKRIVERDRTESLQALVFVTVFHEFNADFGDHHSCSPLCLWHTQEQLRTMNTPRFIPCSARLRSPRAIRRASHSSRQRAKKLLPLPLNANPAGPRTASRSWTSARAGQNCRARGCSRLCSRRPISSTFPSRAA